MINKWAKALKINSWPKILTPFFMGQFMGAHHSGTLRLAPLLWGSVFAICGVIFIVMVNDLGDVAVDTIKRKKFPDGCSPKTIPDNILPARHLKIVAVLCMLIGFPAAYFAGRSIALGQEAFFLGIACCLIFVAYTLPPIKLNYRGGGELLEMIGVGLILPLFAAFLQAGELWVESAYVLIPASTLLALSSALASGLSDEETDRLGRKNTFTTILGNHKVRQGIMTSYWAATAYILVSWLMPFHLPNVVHELVLLNLIYFGIQMQKKSQYATTNAFAAIGVYKSKLHSGIWLSMLGGSALLLFFI